jgi:hypothetical protein
LPLVPEQHYRLASRLEQDMFEHARAVTASSPVMATTPIIYSISAIDSLLLALDPWTSTERIFSTSEGESLFVGTKGHGYLAISPSAW